MVQGNLQQHLSDLIEVNAVQVEAIDSALQVRVDYVVRRTQQRRLGSSRCELVVSYFCANPRRRDEVRKVNFSTASISSRWRPPISERCSCTSSTRSPV